MDINVAGRVKNIDLPITKALLPLFESVVNSIDAIDEKSSYLGKVDIEILRGNHQKDHTDKHYNNPIIGFRIHDNGVGFDENNFKSFCTSDSPYKAKKGCKGIGRFLWLKAFHSVHVSSTFESKNKTYCRKFDFSLSESGIENEELFEVESCNIGTEITLNNYGSQYQKHCPKKTQTIAQKIIEHCLSFLLSGACPQILINDHGEMINLKQLFQDEYLSHSEKSIIQVGDHDFTVSYIKVFNRESMNHAIHYCANNREVISENLTDSIPDLKVQPETSDGKPFTFLAYISGGFLDKTVNSARTDFNIARQSAIEFDDVPSLQKIRDILVVDVKEQLSDHLQKVKEEKSEKITDFVRKKPQYRHVLKYQQQAVAEIPPTLNDEKLEIELFKAAQVIELDVKRQSHSYLNSKIKSVKDVPDYRNKYNDFVEKLNAVGKSNLAKYVIHRKVVLDLFNTCLQTDDGGRYALEEGVHEIIFPLRTTSDDIDFSHQNLWIIDEKLAYHHYLASDVPFKKMDIGVESQDRPDLIVFNNPSIFADQKNGYSSIVIIEFKRPMRNDYTEDENPISQVFKYVRKIRNGKQKDNKGRPVKITENTPIYTYIVCDITQKLIEVAEDHTLTITPDEQGYFGYNPKLKTYIEVISFDKLVEDAEKRNQILFDQLHI